MSITRIQDSVFITNVSVDKKKSKTASKTDSFAPVGAAFMEILGHQQKKHNQDEMTEEERKDKERERLEEQWEIAQAQMANIKDTYKGRNIDWVG